MAYTWYTKGSGADFDSHENYVDYTDNIHSQTGVAFNCGAPNVIKNIDNLTDFYIDFTVYYAGDNPGGGGTWNWLNVIGNGTDYFINGSDDYLCLMPDSNGYKPPYKKGLSHITVHVDTVSDKIEYWLNLQKVYTRESAGIKGKSYTTINMCPTGGGVRYAQHDNAISNVIITTEKTEIDKYLVEEQVATTVKATPYLVEEQVATTVKATPYLVEEQTDTTVKATPYLVVDYDKFSVDVSNTYAAERNIERTDSATGTTIRKLYINYRATLNAATKRIVEPTDTVSGGTKRSLYYGAPVNAATKRLVSADDTADVNTLRRLVRTYGNLTNRGDITQVSISLAEATLSDRVTLGIVGGDISPADAIRAAVLDYDADMLADTVTYNAPINSAAKYVQNVTCMYKIDVLMTRPIVYYSGSSKDDIRVHAIKFSSHIASILGLSCVFYGEDFLSDPMPKGTTTYKSLLSSLFGWSSSVPWRLYTVFIRAGVVYVVERGHEPNTVNLDDLDIAGYPSVTRAVYRTTWTERELDGYTFRAPYSQLAPADKPDAGKHPDDPGKGIERTDPDDDTILFTGEVCCGDTTLEYEDGLLISKTVKSADKFYSADYEYDDDRRMISKTENDGEYITYTTIDFDRNTDLGTNTTTTKKYEIDSGSDVTYGGIGVGELIATTVVVTEDLGNGFTGTSTYVDGEYQGSSISGDGKQRVKKSDHLTDQTTKKAQKGKDKDAPAAVKAGKHHLSIATGMPESIIETLVDEVKKYNRSVRETVSLVVVSPVINGVAKYNHVIDFRDALTLGGNTYHLMSNSVTLTPTELKQSLTITRWIL